MPGSIHSQSSINFYKEIKAPQRAISILEDGLKLPFLNEEVPHFWIKNNKSLFDNYDFAKKKLDEWIADGYVTETFQRPPRISALSVATRVLVNDEVKKRLCLDATFLNDLLLSEATALPTLEKAEALVTKDDYFVTLDLRNAYFHVRLHKSDHDKVAFAFPVSNDRNETTFRFFYITILVYGLKPATLVLNILTKPLIDYLATLNIKASIFIDDNRVNNNSATAVSKDVVTVKYVFTKAGWIFNDEKETPPQQEVFYLGFWYSSITGKYKVHENKIRQVERRIKELEEKNLCAAPQELAVIVGKIISFELATSYVPRLRIHKYFSWIARIIKDDRDWRKQKRFPKVLISAFKQAIEDVKKLSGQVRRKHHAYQRFHSHSADHQQVEFAGDGNELYGAYYNVKEKHNYRIVKFENSEGENLSSSHRELLVLYRCIKDNAEQHKNKDLVYFTDSRVLFFWHQFGTANATIAILLLQVKLTCIEHDIILEISWKPRTDSLIQLADTSCRSSTDEFAIKNGNYRKICKFFNFRPKVDLFASSLLHRTKTFYSKMPTLGSSGANALNFNWDSPSFCHPPRYLNFDVFKKIEAESHADLLLIILQTIHNTDLKRFTNSNGHFRSYVKTVAAFESKIHHPGNNPSKFMISKHSWYALRILKHDTLYDFKMSDIIQLSLNDS